MPRSRPHHIRIGIGRPNTGTHVRLLTQDHITVRPPRR